MKDIASGEIISYKLSKTLELDFVIKMIDIAIELTPDSSIEGLIIPGIPKGPLVKEDQLIIKE